MRPGSLVCSHEFSFDFRIMVFRLCLDVDALFISHAAFDFKVQYLIFRIFNLRRIFPISLLCVRGWKGKA
jgi:hypothetical protein